MSDFERALPYILKAEGGLVDNPADPGGRTNKGITQAVYDAWRFTHGQPKQLVDAITDQEVADIYRGKYWEFGHCDALPWPLCLAHFDACVNTGVGQATRFLQRAADVPDDGTFGPRTAHSIPEVKLDTLLMERIKFYDQLVQKRPTLSQFFRGWTHRTLALREIA